VQVRDRRRFGPASTGTEEIRWGRFPTKYCVGLSFGTTVDDDLHPFGLFTPLVFPFAAFVGLTTWVVARAVLLHPELVARARRSMGTLGNLVARSAVP
jgi:hypothetical protein